MACSFRPLVARCYFSADKTWNCNFRFDTRSLNSSGSRPPGKKEATKNFTTAADTQHLLTRFTQKGDVPYHDHTEVQNKQLQHKTAEQNIETTTPTTTKSHPRKQVPRVDHNNTTGGRQQQCENFRSQKLSPGSKLRLLAEPQPVHASPGTASPVPPPLLSPRNPAPALSALTPSPAATIPRSPHHLFADLHGGRRVLEGEAPRHVAQVEGPDLENRSAVGSACRVGADVALEGRPRAVQERLVPGNQELQSLL